LIGKPDRTAGSSCSLVADPATRVIGLEALRHGAFDPEMYDVRQGALHAAIVGRWEYAPGSTAFIVY
jgi:hypothetical protein